MPEPIEVEPIEVEVVAVDGRPPPPRHQARPVPTGPWVRFDHRFARTRRPRSSILAWLLGGLVALTLLAFALFALALALVVRFLRGLLRILLPARPAPGSLTASR